MLKHDNFIQVVERNIFVISLTIVNAGTFINSGKVDIISMNFNELPFSL